jgi:hypothetical protein
VFYWSCDGQRHAQRLYEHRVERDEGRATCFVPGCTTKLASDANLLGARPRLVCGPCERAGRKPSRKAVAEFREKRKQQESNEIARQRRQAEAMRQAKSKKSDCRFLHGLYPTMQQLGLNYNEVSRLTADHEAGPIHPQQIGNYARTTKRASRFIAERIAEGIGVELDVLYGQEERAESA